MEFPTTTRAKYVYGEIHGSDQIEGEFELLGDHGDFLEVRMEHNTDRLFIRKEWINVIGIREQEIDQERTR